MSILLKKIDDYLIEKLRCVKQRLVIDFEDYNVTKLVYVFYTVDDMCISIISNSLEDIKKKKQLVARKCSLSNLF